MTNQELRIAKLSRILNNSSLNQDLGRPVIQAAYQRAMNEIQQSIKEEKDFHAETEARQRMQFSIEKQEENMRESMRKHHFNVLKKQIEDRRKQRDINEVEKLMERPKSLPKTPPEQPKFFVREGLKQQIKEKKKEVKEKQKNELDYDRFLIKVAKTSLDDDIKKKKIAKNEVFDKLKQSWNEAQVLNGLKKQADRLKYFANSKVTSTSPANKAKYFNKPRNRTTENSPAKPEQEKAFSSEQKTEKDILKKIERIDERTKKIEEQKEILKKIQSIEEHEQSIKKEKQLILDFLSSKKKKSQ